MDTKRCTECGTAFKRSPTDYTVRCPACRAIGRGVAKSSTAKAWKPVTCDIHGVTYTTLNCPKCRP